MYDPTLPLMIAAAIVLTGLVVYVGLALSATSFGRRLIIISIVLALIIALTGFIPR